MKEEATRLADFSPAALPPGLADRLLSAMQGVVAEEASYAEEERQLRRLSPAPLDAPRETRLLGAMHAAAKRLLHSGVSYVRRWAAAAAALVLLLGGGAALLLSNSAEADDSPGLASRSVIQAKVASSVQWRDSHTAVRHCDVTYEDAFVLDDGDNATITVRVPNRTTIVLEDEVI